MMKPIVPPPFFTFSILIVTQFAPSPLLTKALLNLYAAQGIFFEKMATAICCQRNLHPVSFFFLYGNEWLLAIFVLSVDGNLFSYF